MSPGDILTEADLLELLGISRQTSIRMRKAGELPFFRVRGRPRYRRVDVERWIERKLRESDSFTTVVDGMQVVL